MRTPKSLKYIIALILVGFLSCEKESNELVIENDLMTSPTVNIEYLNLDQLLEDSEIGEISRKFQSRKHSGSKASKAGNWVEISNKITVSTHRVKKINDGISISWTFRTKKTLVDRSHFENFLVKKYNGNFSYYLVSYVRDRGSEKEFKNTAYPYRIPEKHLDLSEISLFSSDDFDWAPPDDGGADIDCGCINVYDSCSVGGNPDGHSPQLQSDGSYCSGSPLAYIDCSHCDDGVSTGSTGSLGGGNDGGSDGGNTLPDLNSSGSGDDGGSSGTTLTSPTYEDGTIPGPSLGGIF